MNDTIERLGTSEVRIQVQIPWSELTPRYNESLSKLRSTIQVRGFRKGKVPVAMLQRMMGDKLTHEIAVEEVGKKVQKLFSDEKIFPLHVPLDIERSVQVKDGQEATYESRIEVLPMIDQIRFDELDLPSRPEVTDEQVNERLKLMAARKAPLMTAPDDHVIAEYDQVVLEGQATFTDEEEPQEVKDFRVDLAPWTQPPPGIVGQLVGKKKGHEDETNLVLPTRENEETRPRYASLEYTVSQVVTRDVPTVDDELARDFDMESLQELADEVREALEKEVLDEYIGSAGNDLMEQLVEKVQFDLPPSYAQITKMNEGKDGAEGDEDEKKRQQEKEMASALEKMMRRNLLVMVISQQNGLSLPQEAVQQASERMRAYIDRQEGSKKEKDEAFDKWKQEFEQNLFDHMLSSFLVQEVEKAKGIQRDDDQEARSGDESEPKGEDEDDGEDEETTADDQEKEQ